MQGLDALAARDAAVTVQYQDGLLKRGLCGQLAFGLFRAQKNSVKAKGYVRGVWRRGAYEVKNESIDYVDTLLQKHGEALKIKWGWKKDKECTNYEHVLYVDVFKFGQASFHASRPSSDKRYEGEWSGIKNTGFVIANFCDWVMTQPEKQLDVDDLMFFGKHSGKPIGQIDQAYLDYLKEWAPIENWTCLHGVLRIKEASKAC